WTALRRIRRPIAAIVGGRDEYLDRRPAELLAAFERNAIRAPSFTGIVVPGARDGFQHHEDMLARVIVRSVQTVYHPRHRCSRRTKVWHAARRLCRRSRLPLRSLS